MKFDTYVPSTIVANIALAVGLGNLHEPEHDALLYPLLVNYLVHGGSDDPILDHHLVLDALHDKFFDGEYEGGIRLASISRISGRGRLSLQERLYSMKVQIDGTYYKRCDIDLRNMYEALGHWMEGHLDLVSTIFREFLWDHTDGQLEWTVHEVKQIIIAHLKSPDYRNDIIQAVFSPGMVPPHYSGSRLLTGCVLLPHMHWVATYCSHGYISAATASGHRDARRDVSDEERLCLLGEIVYCDRIFRELLDQKILVTDKVEVAYDMSRVGHFHSGEIAADERGLMLFGFPDEYYLHDLHSVYDMFPALRHYLFGSLDHALQEEYTGYGISYQVSHDAIEPANAYKDRVSRCQRVGKFVHALGVTDGGEPYIIPAMPALLQPVTSTLSDGKVASGYLSYLWKTGLKEGKRDVVSVSKWMIENY